MKGIEERKIMNSLILDEAQVDNLGTLNLQGLQNKGSFRPMGIYAYDSESQIKNPDVSQNG